MAAEDSGGGGDYYRRTITMWEGGRASKTFHVCNFGLYVYMFYVYMHTYRPGNLSVYMHTYRHKAKKAYRIGSHFLCLYAHMPKEITFYVFLGEKRDPSEIYANSNLRNLTQITQKTVLCLYVFHLCSKKSQPKHSRWRTAHRPRLALRPWTVVLSNNSSTSTRGVSPTLSILKSILDLELESLNIIRSVTANIGWYVVSILHDRPSWNINITWL
jgi:hypothetical protein